MGIRAGLGNLGASVKSAFQNKIDALVASTKAIFDATVTRIGSVYTGGFIGIDTNNWPVIKSAIEELINHASDDLNKFQELAKRDNALKGDASEALGSYLINAQNLLTAYITTYRNFITDAETALGAMVAGDQANAASIQEASNALQQEANRIRVD